MKPTHNKNSVFNLYSKFPKEDYDILTTTEMMCLTDERMMLKYKKSTEFREISQDVAKKIEQVEKKTRKLKKKPKQIISPPTRRRRLKKISKEERDLVTSLDIEKKKDILEKVNMRGPNWKVGLIINTMKTHHRNGSKRKKKKKNVKCLTIIFITTLTISRLQDILNSDKDNPYTCLKDYTGMLFIIYWFHGFKTFIDAKHGFICLKDKTRGGFSRFVCSTVTYKLLKESNVNLKQFKVVLTPKENIIKSSTIMKRKRNSSDEDNDDIDNDLKFVKKRRKLFKI